MEGEQKAAGVSEKSTAVVKSEPEEDDDASGHVCRVCGRGFPLLSSLSQHMRRHTREKPYKCPYCEHRTAQKGSLKAHIRSHKLGLLSPSAAAGDKEGEEGGLGQKDDTTETFDHGGGSPGFAESASSEHEGRRVNGKVETRKGPVKKKAKSGDDVEAAAEEEEETPANTDRTLRRSKEEDAKSGPFPCGQCSQVFPKALLLKAHMKRHRGPQDHGCRICGRRFRQAWFLQSHMRIHKAKAALRSGKDGGGPPATVNGVPQDPASLTNEDCVYELCAGCGNFFHDRKALRIHDARAHKQNNTTTSSSNNGRPQSLQQPPRRDDLDGDDATGEIDKTRFLESLNLVRVTPSGRGKSPSGERSQQQGGGRIPQLDPVCSYQAWQLVTRGRLAEVTERYLGWEERLADAEVSYDQDKGEYVPLKQERKRKQSADASSGCNVKKKKGAGATAASHSDRSSSNSLTHSIGGGGRKILNRSSDRILFNGLGNAFYGALQKQTVKDASSSAAAKPANSIRNHAKEDGKKRCEHCDFHAADASSLWSHVRAQHQDVVVGGGPRGKQPTTTTAILDNLSQTNSKASYMDYLRNRSAALLSQTHPYPAAGPPASGQERSPASSSVRTEKSKGAALLQAKGQGDATVEAANLLNLSALSEGQGEDGGADGGGDRPAKTAGLVRHQCPYCSHTTNYPEVLWIHQRVAHKVDGASSLAPRWAPSANFKGSRTSGGALWRRTAGPPFLEGKDCPALPAPKSQRTQPPCSSSHGGGNSSSGGSGSKRSATKTPAGASANKSKLATQPKDSQSSADGSSSGGKMTTAPLPQKKKYAEQQTRPTDAAGSKGANHVHHHQQVTSSSSRPAAHGKSAPNAQSVPNAQLASSSPKHRGNRVAVEGNLVPQEGLGFMLARNYGRTPFHGTADRSHRHPHPHGQTRDSPAVPKGHHDVWSAMSMWGMHGGGRAYLDPVLFAQGKSESAGDMPMDIDILSLLKNYSPHDLAALYQHWGFVDPRFDPQAMLQLNGNFGSEVHSSSEASKQVDSHSTSSSGSLQKGM